MLIGPKSYHTHSCYELGTPCAKKNVCKKMKVQVKTSHLLFSTHLLSLVAHTMSFNDHFLRPFMSIAHNFMNILVHRA